MTTPVGDLTYRLVALIYYNGSHYITVGRTDIVSGGANQPASLRVLDASQWVCWDGVGGGRGCVLDGPPTSHGVLRARGGDREWCGFRAESVIYCRVR